MRIVHWSAALLVVGGCLIFRAAIVPALRSGAAQAPDKARTAQKSTAPPSPSEAARFNTLGVAFMNQQKPADAEHLGYQLEYNTRTRSDRLSASLRCHYPKPK